MDPNTSGKNIKGVAVFASLRAPVEYASISQLVDAIELELARRTPAKPTPKPRPTPIPLTTPTAKPIVKPINLTTKPTE